MSRPTPMLLACLAAVIGCAPSGRATPPAPIGPAELAPGDESPPRPPKDSRPAGSSPPKPSSDESPTSNCELSIRTRVTTLDDGRFAVATVLENKTASPLELTWVSRCPGPGLHYDGLPPGYDSGETCRAGACASGPEQRHVLQLPPRASREVGKFQVESRGSGCNESLPAGSYDIRMNTAISGARLCSPESDELLVEGPSRPPPTTTRPDSQPGRKQPTAPKREPEPEPCPAMACLYEPCPPGVEPPTGCAAACGCAGMRYDLLRTAPKHESR